MKKEKGIFFEKLLFINRHGVAFQNMRIFIITLVTNLKFECVSILRVSTGMLISP